MAVCDLCAGVWMTTQVTSLRGSGLACGFHHTKDKSSALIEPAKSYWVRTLGAPPTSPPGPLPRCAPATSLLHEHVITGVVSCLFLASDPHCWDIAPFAPFHCSLAPAQKTLLLSVKSLLARYQSHKPVINRIAHLYLKLHLFICAFISRVWQLSPPTFSRWSLMRWKSLPVFFTLAAPAPREG